MKEQLLVKNSLSDIEQFQTKMGELLRGLGFSNDLVHDLTLVCEEVLVNIVSYGYPEAGDGTQDISITLSVDDQRVVVLEFRDQATAFNPLLVEERDPEDERVGGWGIPMLKSLTDRVEYSREGRENVLTMVRGERDS